MIDSKILLIFCTFFLLISTAQAQSTDKPAQFDLVLFGSSLDAQHVEVWLKENPGIENNWQKLTSGQTVINQDDNFSILVFSSLVIKKFAGQDLRENYIAIKVAATDGQENSELRAMYVFPHSDYSSEKLALKLHKVTRSHPGELQKYSLAQQVRPRPHQLSDGTAFIEHIEMPVRHHKPGLQEVKWLNIIFSNE